MGTLLLSKEEQGIVIFHIWKSLPYNIRLGLSVFLIFIGFVIQYYSYEVMPGAIFVLAGNLLLIVKGYDNRIKLASYKAGADWVKTDKEQLDNIVKLNTKVKRWDISAIDISNPMGVTFFILLGFAIFILYVYGFGTYNPGIEIVAINIAIMLFPHWFTGIKRITTLPKLINKINIYRRIMKNFGEDLAKDEVNFMMWVRGKEKKLPSDVKMKVEFKGQPEGFLGMYAQTSINNVQGKDYPYFYVVLVAKPEFQLIKKYYESVEVPRKVIKEKSRKDGVEIIVIRQYTTKTGGYHTNSKAIHKIFECGVQTARQIIG
ncbi:MAG: hypothetical protein B6I20_07655 [Bacteroidetes bacterium 4572_117]|nr:MAG: hypothetical protein B6I20_07655 [Bacteroidetes bacterium 4572_117]